MGGFTMSDLAASNCGCGCENSGGISNLFGGNSCSTLILLLVLLSCCGNNNNGCGCGFDQNNSCLWIILLLCCCGNGCGGF